MQPDPLRQDAAAYIKLAVARGRDTCADIVANTVDYLYGNGDPDDIRALGSQLVGPAFAAHLEAQATWPTRTDNDRLTDAFRTLDASGIVAREDFACCQNCGATEIHDEILDTAPARGYVFYHGQDGERAAGGGSLWLAYGSLGEPTATEIGEEVVAALRAQDLRVDWSGSPGQRIHVTFGWARRRHGRLAAYIPGDVAEPGVDAEIIGDRPPRFRPRMSAAALARLELPWLGRGVSVRLDDGERSLVIHREHHRLVSDDGRSVGRFDGLRLIRGEDSSSPADEPGLLDVTFQSGRTGPRATAAQPMVLSEALDVLRRLPTRTNSWLCAVSGTEGVVQLRWEDGRLWLETPHPEDHTSTGTYASLAEAERMVTILATEDRVAIADLDGATRQRWG